MLYENLTACEDFELHNRVCEFRYVLVKRSLDFNIELNSFTDGLWIV